jgi:hypothetical protein
MRWGTITGSASRSFDAAYVGRTVPTSSSAGVRSTMPGRQGWRTDQLRGALSVLVDVGNRRQLGLPDRSRRCA